LPGLKQSNTLLAPAKESITNRWEKIKRRKKEKKRRKKKRKKKADRLKALQGSQKVPIPHHSALHGPERAKQPMMTSKWHFSSQIKYN
jgi:hypothetical protein